MQSEVESVLEWLEDNMEAESSEYDEKKEELEQVANPIMSAFYQANGGPEGGAAGGAEGDDDFDDDAFGDDEL